MKTFIKILVVLIVIGVIAVVAFFYLGLNRLVRFGVEAGGSQLMQTNVTLENVKLSPLTGRGSLENLKVKNPEGFDEGNAFELGSVKMRVKPRSLFSDTIVIREIFIDGPIITYDRTLTKGNIGQLKRNIEEALGPRKERPIPDEEEPKPRDKPRKAVSLDHFVMENGRVHLTSSMVKGDPVTLSLGRIELRNLGTGDKTASAAAILNLIYTEVFRAVIEAVSESSLDFQLDDEALKQLTDQAGELGGKVDAYKDRLKDEADSVRDTVRGLLGGDKDE